MLNVALAQTESLSHDLSNNLIQHIDAISDAISRKANIVVFPEFSIHGSPKRETIIEIALDDRHEHIQELAEKSVGIISLVSGIEVTIEGLFYNTVYVLKDGEILAKHRKINIPTYGRLNEGAFFARGKQHTSFNVNEKAYTAGILTCADSWNPALVYLQALCGNQLLLQPISAARNSVEGHYDNIRGWQINIQHSALTWGMFVVMVNRVGEDDGLSFFGQSSVIDPYGNVLLKMGNNAELKTIEIDLADTIEARFNLPTLRDSESLTIQNLISSHFSEAKGQLQ